MANLDHTVWSKVPDHIIENHPQFVEFLRAYYEWLSKPGNPYNAVKHHLDYLNFEQSIDDYVSLLKDEYLCDVPEDVLIDKELFIKWSRKFNLSRGSHESYQFLFRLLFNEDDTEIYLPKRNILRTSDGSWTSGESILLVTNTVGNEDKFLFQRIVQRRQVYEDIYEYAYATVQRVRTKYAGRYNVTELSVINIDGEFKEGYPIENETGDFEWPIPTTQQIVIGDEGRNYQESQRIEFVNFDTFKIEREATETGSYDVRITSYLRPTDISLHVDQEQITDFEFDGRVITSDAIDVGSVVCVTLPAYQGYFVVDQVDTDGSIRTTNLLDASIGYPADMTMRIAGNDSATIQGVAGITKPETGKFLDERGWLSSTMYLQDSFYYQDYSYVVKTQQDIESYGTIVKELLHPAGFAMFGSLSIVDILELLLQIVFFSVEKQNKSVLEESDYGLGPNYSFLDRFKGGLSKRLYRLDHFRDHDIEMSVGAVDSYGRGTALYDYNSASRGTSHPRGSLVSEYIVSDYFPKDYIGASFDSTSQFEVFKGWMTKDNLSDYYLYVPQTYSEEVDSGSTYFETGYVAPRQ